MKEAIELFNNYYNKFDHTLDGVVRKYEHTFRVVAYAQRIARSLNLNEDDFDLASRCALFHDISRFKQWTDYKTFEDSVSYDHGDMSETIIKELGITDEIILKAVKHHNKMSVPEEFDDRTKLFCNITRDADKLDIMIDQDKEFKDDKLLIPDDEMESFYNHTLVKNDPVAWDYQSYHIFRSMAFMFDFKFKESFKIVKDNDYVNDRCDKVLAKFDDERIIKIKEICNKYIDERISD